MFCSKCGKENAGDAKFCAGCGALVAAADNLTASPMRDSAQQVIDVRATLKAYRVVSRIDVECERCAYKGVMGWVSSDKFKIGGLVLPIISFLIVALALVFLFFMRSEWKLAAMVIVSGSVTALFTFYLSILKITKTNLFDCPVCKHRFVKAVFTRPNT
jgi:hypothetical protein